MLSGTFIPMISCTAQAALPGFLQKTAWPMTPPAPWSAFHVMVSLSGLLIAGFLARFLAQHYKSHACLILWICGVLLGTGELYKQLFLYEIVNHGRYDWWYFPFQLCSTPMYLCLVFPLLPGGIPRRTAAAYLESFGLLGGIMALTEPSGLMHPYWTLTLHGFLWHFILILLGVYCGRKGLADAGAGGFFRMLPLYGLCCSIAIFINTMEQLCIYPRDYSDLFYINCFFPSEQPFFHQLSLWLGNVWCHILYVLASCCGAGLIHLAWAVYPRLHPRKKS